MQIAMQANLLGRMRLELLFYHLQQVFGDREVGGLQACRHHIGAAQVIQTVPAEALPVEGRPVLEGAHRTDRMQAADQATEHQQMVGIVELGGVATKPAEQAEAKPCMLEQRAAVDLLLGNHRDLAYSQFKAEGMLLENRLIAPAVRSIELGDQRCGAFYADLKYPVFVTVQGQDARIREIAKRLDRVQHGVRGEGRKGMAGHGGRLGANT